MNQILTKKRTLMSAVAVVAATTWLVTPAHAGPGCSGSSAHPAKPAHAETASAKPDIVEAAISAGQFSTLVTALKAAGLVETLQSDGPFTVFAPTDEAFAKLPAGTLEHLLKDTEALKRILLYHVASGNFSAGEVVKRSTLPMLAGPRASIDTRNGPQIDNAKIVATDVHTRNGVIHVIDTVILPKNDIVAVAESTGTFNTLLAALDAADLTGALRADGPFTVFAPTDEAFAKLPPGTVESLLKDPDKLREILLHHVVPGKVTAEDVAKLHEAKTLQGGTVALDTSNGVRVGNAQVVQADVAADNGVIHVVDAVILPQ